MKEIQTLNFTSIQEEMEKYFTTEAMNELNEAFLLPNDGTVLKQIKGQKIITSSFRRIKPGTWLNDEVINYYLCLMRMREQRLYDISSRTIGGLQRKRTYFMKSFFVTKLLDIRHPDRSQHRYTYENVRRWGTKCPGGNIFHFQQAFIPINIENRHWVCVFISIETQKIVFYDSLPNSTLGEYYINIILKYLEDKWNYKRMSGSFDTSSWTKVSLGNSTNMLQTNCDDCGVYTLMCAYFICNDLEMTFLEQENREQQRKNELISRHSIGASILQNKIHDTTRVKCLRSNVIAMLFTVCCHC